MERDSGTRGGSGSEPENLLRSCAVLLARRDFNGCREFVHRVPRSDPNISMQADRILAIADVLGAAERRLGNNHLDWHSILQLRRGDAGNRDLARRQFKNLVRLLDPNKNKLPFSGDALMRVREAWFVLSDTARRARFEREIENSRPNKGTDKNGGDLDATSFWTMCPYCWYLHEYERKYEDCSFRCGNCRKTFHGVAVKPPTPEMVVEGKEQYYCCHVSLPLRYPTGGPHFDYMFDDDVRDSSKDECERVAQGNGRNGKRRMRIKTVANRVRMKGYVDPKRNLDSYAEEDGELEFTQGDGDIFVGVRFGE